MDPQEDTPIEDHRPPHHRHRGAFREAGETVSEAAIEAEMLTGRREETVEEARQSLWLRSLRAVGGFLLIGVGIALLPLPGPGWVIIIIGLSLLPFAWAERTIKLIRSKIPGIPDEGRIPLTTWLVMGAVVVFASVIVLAFGSRIGELLTDAWSGFWD